MELSHLRWILEVAFVAAAGVVLFWMWRRKCHTEVEYNSLRQAFEQLPANVVLADADMLVASANADSRDTLRKLDGAAKRLEGRTLESLLGSSDAIERILAAPGISAHRETLRLGQETFDFRASVLRHSDGSARGLVGVWREPEGRSQRWAELLQVVDELPLNVMLASRTGKVTYVNPHAKTTLGRLEHLKSSEPGEFVGRSVEDLLGRSLALRGEGQAETLQLGGDEIEVHAVPLPDSKGRWAGSLVSWALVPRKRRAHVAALHMLEELDSATGHLTSCAVDLIANAEQTAAKASEMLERTREVTDSTNSVANATEEMSGTINELSRNTRELADGVDKAVAAVDRSRDIVQGLRDAGREISRVSETITDIADQTNLLALNATIEAAGAGDAGRGFAVVATEVKELARETMQATDSIDRQVQSIISRSEDVALAVTEIADVIGGVNSLATTLASAVEEQSRTTSEIAVAVTLAAETATAIGAEMIGLTEAADSATSTARSIQTSSEELNTLSLALDKTQA